MDDEQDDGNEGEKKSLSERITHTVKGIVDSTSEAAMKAMQPSEPDPKHAEAREQASDPTDTVAAPEVVIKRATKKSRPKTKKSVGTLREQLTVTKKTRKKKAAKKAKTTAKKSRGMTMAKKSKKKSAVKKSAVKKTAKKMMPKKKSRR